MRSKPSTARHHVEPRLLLAAPRCPGRALSLSTKKWKCSQRAGALERAVDRPQPGEDALDRLVADRHDDRGARRRASSGAASRAPSRWVIAKRSRRRTSVKKPSSAVQKPIEIQPKSAPKKTTIATSSQVPPWCGSTFTMKPLATMLGISTRSASSSAAPVRDAGPRQAAALRGAAAAVERSARRRGRAAAARRTRRRRKRRSIALGHHASGGSSARHRRRARRRDGGARRRGAGAAPARVEAPARGTSSAPPRARRVDRIALDAAARAARAASRRRRRCPAPTARGDARARPRRAASALALAPRGTPSASR